MALFYLLKEDGGRITLEDGSGAILLEASIPGPSIDWQPGGAGHPVRKHQSQTEALFRSIEESLEAALGLVPLPDTGEAQAAGTAVEAPQWSEEKLQDALEILEREAQASADLQRRLTRLRSLVTAYEEWLERERQITDEEETWFLMS